MLDIFNMIFDCIDSVFDTLDTSVIFQLKNTSVSLGDMLWGFFILSVIFTFFLVPRAGSGLGGIRNIGSYIQSERPHQNTTKGDK